MLVCGFPANILGKMNRGKKPPFPDMLWQNLAAHMFPVPVFMAIFLATLASVPWTTPTTKHGMDEQGSIYARLKELDIVYGKNRKRTALAVALSMPRDEPSQPTVATKQPKVSQSRGSKD